MIRAVVLADTHIPDHARALPEALLADLRRADVILHAGDVTAAEVLEELSSYAPVHVALGNNDGPSVRRFGAREVVCLDLGGVPTVLVHDTGSRLGRERRLARRFPGARLIVFGHSHIPVLTEFGDALLLNPGSPTWKRRQPVPTYAVVRVVRGRVDAVLRAVVPQAKTRHRSRVRSAPARA